LPFIKLNAATVPAEVSKEFSTFKNWAKEGGLISAHFRHPQYKVNTGWQQFCYNLLREKGKSEI